MDGEGGRYTTPRRKNAKTRRERTEKETDARWKGSGTSGDGPDALQSKEAVQG